MKKIDSVCESLNIDFRPESDIKFINRLGERKDNNIRPIVMGFRVQSIRDLLLNRAYRLKNSPNFSEVRVLPDLTPQQRKEEADLRVEADNRNAELKKAGNLSTEWRVVGGKGAKFLKKCAIPTNTPVNRVRGRQGDHRGEKRKGAGHRSPDSSPPPIRQNQRDA